MQRRGKLGVCRTMHTQFVPLISVPDAGPESVSTISKEMLNDATEKVSGEL